MTDLIVSLKTESMALARVEAVSENHVTIAIDAGDKWNAEGLLKLAAVLKGVAATIAAAVLILGSLTVVDAIDWVPYNQRVEAADYSD